MQKKRGKSVRGAVFGPKEKKRLIQLGLCLCMFLVILVGRGSELAEKSETGEKMLQMIRDDTDFVGAFSALGESVSQGESVWEGLKSLAFNLFGVTAEEEEVQSVVLVYGGPAANNAVRMLSAPATKDSMLNFLGVSPVEVLTDNEDEPLVDDHTEENKESIALDAPEIPEYNGPALPANATMEYYDLGLQTTVTPVLGVVSSAYGYRDHPISGDYLFHAGVDIAASSGTPIAAFADGVVEFIGESNAYGLYVQVDHGNGVKSFYCHCSKLLYGKGTNVTAGQTIALVGDTGNTTGPHLHLELKKDETLLNPVYYIESEH